MGLIKRVSASALTKIAADKLSQLRQVDEHNSNLMSGYRNRSFVGLKMWPIVTARKESGKFSEFGPSPFIDKEKLKTALGSKRVRLDYSTATGSYVTNRFEVDVPIYDRELEEVADSDLDSFVEAKTMLGADVIQLAMEVYVATVASDPNQYAAGFTQTNAGSSQWKQTASTPLSDLRNAVRKVALQVGRPYSELAIAISPKVWEALQDHAAIQAKIQYGAGPSNPSVVTTDALAKVFGVGSVDILASQYATSIDPLDPTATAFSFLWGDVAIVYLPIAKPSFADPIWAAIVRKVGYPYVDEYRDPSIDATIKVARDNWGVTLRANNRAYLILNASGLYG